MSRKLDFRRDLKLVDTHQVAKWMGYARGGRQYHALAAVNGNEIVYSISNVGPYWYLHFSDDQYRYEVFDRKCDAVASAHEDFAKRWPT